MYKIGEVSKLTGIKTHTLRFWEGKFEHIKSINNKTKTRYYDSFAISEFYKIKDLLNNHGIKLSGIMKMIKNGKIQVKRLERVKNIAVQNLLFNEFENNQNTETITHIKHKIVIVKNILENILK